MKIKSLFKLFVLLVVLYVIGLFASRYYVQSQYESKLAELKVVLSSQPNHKFEIMDSSYESGLFASHAMTMVNVTLTPYEADKFFFVFDSNIEHGPWLGGIHFGWAKVDTTVHVKTSDNEFNKILEELFSDDKVAFSQAFVNFANNVSGTLEIEKVRFDSKNGDDVSFDFQGGRGSFTQDAINLTFPHFSFVDNTFRAESFSFDNMKIMQTQLANAQVKSNIAVGNLTLVNPRSFRGLFNGNVDGINIQNANLNSLDSYNGSLINSVSDMQFSINTIGNDVLPEAMVVKVNYEGKNINNGILKRVSANFGAQDSEAMLKEFLDTNPEMSMHVEATYKNESALLDASVSASAIQESILPLYQQVLLNIKAKANVSIPVSLATNREMVFINKSSIDGLLMAGILIPDGTNYVGDFSYKGGKVTLNGETNRIF